MKEKYCPVPISTCEFMNSEKADCNSCDLNKRYSKRTVDNWETYIVDNGTGREYGYNVDNILDLLNSQEERIESLHETIAELDECQKGQSHRINNLCHENKQLKDLIIHLGYTIKYTGYREISLELIK